MHKQCLKEKFFHIIGDVLENYEVLGLPKEDKKKFAELKMNTKKAMIQSMCEVELIMVDMMGALWQNPVNTGEINKMIDKKYDLKRENMKHLVQAFASFKKMLSEEQLRKLMQLCKEQKHTSEACCR